MDPIQPHLTTDISGAPLLPDSLVSHMSLSDSRHIASDEPVRTLFVSGLPADVKQRELHNLFRPFEGFQHATISYTGERKMPVSFVVFSDQESALIARNRLQGINFDPESSTTLRIELAKSNSKSKLPKKAVTRSVRRVDPYKSSLQGNAFQDNQFTTDPLSSAPTMNTLDQPGIYAEPSPNTFSPTSYFTDRSNPFLPRQSPPQPQPQPPIAKVNPCTTLFIGNISPLADENDLEAKLNEVLASFEKIKLSRKGDSLMCFIDFKTVQSSNAARTIIQNMNLPAAEGRRIRIEYARSKMGKLPTWS